MKWINIHDKLPNIIEKGDNEVTEDSEHVIVYHTIKGIGIGSFYKWKPVYDRLSKKTVKHPEIENEENYLCSAEFISTEVEDGEFANVYENIHIYKPHTDSKDKETITHWMSFPGIPE